MSAPVLERLQGVVSPRARLAGVLRRGGRGPALVGRSAGGDDAGGGGPSSARRSWRWAHGRAAGLIPLVCPAPAPRRAARRRRRARPLAVGLRARRRGRPGGLLAPRPFAPGLRAVLWASVFYQFATLVTVVNNPYAANAVEWAHAGMLVAGACSSGGRSAPTATDGSGCACSSSRSLAGRHHGHRRHDPVRRRATSRPSPTFPFPMHKNFAGTLCATRGGDGVRPSAVGGPVERAVAGPHDPDGRRLCS